MSEIIGAAVEALKEKLGGEVIDTTVKFVMGDEGSFMIDVTGVHAGDGEADVTLTADVDTFQEIFEGVMDPTSAFMSGKLTIDGDMGAAMKLASVLA